MAITLKDIANKTGVSYSTVSRAVNQETAKLVNPKTRERVLRAVEKYGYIPNRYARSLKVNVRQARVVGFTSAWFPQILMGEFVGRMMTGVAEECERLHYDMELFPVLKGDAGEISKQLLFGRILDGILIFGYEGGGPFFERLASLDLPQVLINCFDPDAREKNFVYCDGRKGAKRIVEHLIEQGHREIAIITGARNTRDAIERLRGYEDALTASGIEVRADLIFEGSFMKQGGYDAGKEMVSTLGRLPDAVFCSNDDIAIGFLRMCGEAGIRVPDDVAVAGFDNTEQSRFARPPITTISQPAEELGKRSVRLLYELIEKRCTAPVQVEVPTELIVRASSESAPERIMVPGNEPARIEM